MKIITDLYVNVPKNFWEDKLTEDPLEFPSIRAVEGLAEEHECHFFGCSQEEYGDKEIKGMYYHLRRDWKEWLPEISRINPDVILTNGYFDISVAVASAAPKAKKIFVLHCEPVIAIKQFGFNADWYKFTKVISPLELGVRQLHYVWPTLPVTYIPFGVNVDLCRSYVKPMETKDSLVCGSSWRLSKGSKYVDEVLRTIRNKFNKPVGMNWGGMPKRQYLEKMSESRVLFFPSATEGTSRSVSEAAACGVLPVVAIESASNVEHIKKLGGATIVTGMFNAPHPDDSLAVQFTRTAEDIAQELIHIAQTTTSFLPNLSPFDAKNTIKSYQEVLLA